MASETTLNEIIASAKEDEYVSTTTSLVQVEYGMNHLLGLWDGFADSSDYYKETFAGMKEVSHAFADSICHVMECGVIQ